MTNWGTPEVTEALNRLAKWRMIFAGWQLGTRNNTDPEAQAVRDHREATIMMRAEINAMLSLLVAKGVFTAAEWEEQVIKDANYLSKQYEEKFPGCHATDVGMVIKASAAEWMKKWRP